MMVSYILFLSAFLSLNVLASAQQDYLSSLFLKEIELSANKPFPTVLYKVFKSCEDRMAPEVSTNLITSNSACINKHIIRENFQKLNHTQQFPKFCHTFNFSKTDCFPNYRQILAQHKCIMENHTDMFDFTSKYLELLCKDPTQTLHHIETSTKIPHYHCYNENIRSNVELCVDNKAREQIITDSYENLGCSDFQIVEECLETHYMQKCSSNYPETVKFFEKILSSIDNEFCPTPEPADHDEKANVPISNATSNPGQDDDQEHSKKSVKITKAIITDKTHTQCPDKKKIKVKKGEQIMSIDSLQTSLLDENGDGIKLECVSGSLSKMTNKTPVVIFLNTLVIFYISL